MADFPILSQQNQAAGSSTHLMTGDFLGHQLMNWKPLGLHQKAREVFYYPTTYHSHYHSLIFQENA
jgi:hypothetical protein